MDGTYAVVVQGIILMPIRSMVNSNIGASYLQRYVLPDDILLYTSMDVGS